MQRKIAPPQIAELRERPIPEVMRAEEKMKTQLSIRIATRSRRLGLAVKGMSEWEWEWEWVERRTDHQVGGQRFS